MKLLFAIYLALVVDMVTGLSLNLFGYGREPLVFAVCTVLVASFLYWGGRFWIGMMTLVLCCAWFLFYPQKNGFDVILSPLLLMGIVTQLWHIYQRRQYAKNED